VPPKVRLAETAAAAGQREAAAGWLATLDDIIDHMKNASMRMLNYGITETDSYMTELARLIQLSVVEIEEAVKGIRTLKKPRQIEQRCIEVNRLENLADDVLNHAINELFKSTDALAIIKKKDIYEYLELATDKCEDVANVLSDIAIRHT